MVVARTREAREALKAQFQAHSIDREYEAICRRRGCRAHHRDAARPASEDRLRFTTPDPTRKAGGHSREAASRALGGATHVACTLETGRTHQIRVHLAEGGTPGPRRSPLRGSARDAAVRAVGERLGHQACTPGSWASCTRAPGLAFASRPRCPTTFLPRSPTSRGAS